MKRNFNLPLDYIHCTYQSFCWLLFPWTKGRWVALKQSDRKKRPTAFWGIELKPLYSDWSIVIPWTIHNCTRNDIHGRNFKGFLESLFGDAWYRNQNK